jgi:hypothetical protein
MEGLSNPNTMRLASSFSLFSFLLLLTFLPTHTHAAGTNSGSRVSFDPSGIAIVDGKPFFPIGMFTYELTPEVLAELHELQCNTILHGFQPDQLDLIQDHGLMAICSVEGSWVRVARDHPALLAWYLADEPENHGLSPSVERNFYQDLKKRDPNHPIGLCHTSFEALTQYKEACDFTMTDIYPITANRDKNVMGVSIMMDEARRIHGANWPQWTCIQAFGGPETDNGVWAVPLPHEVRFMVYQALVHRATGILYFAYWPRQPRSWQSIATLNAEVQRLVPRLVAPGKEIGARAETAEVQVRTRLLADGNTGLVIAINTSPRFVETVIQSGARITEASLPFEFRTVRVDAGSWAERFPPYGVHVYTWGHD